MQNEVEVELDRLVGQEGSIHTKMLALQRMGYIFIFDLSSWQLKLLLLLANVVSAWQAQSAADRRRCQSAGWHDNVYLQPGWKCQSQSQTVGPRKGKVLDLLGIKSGLILKKKIINHLFCLFHSGYLETLISFDRSHCLFFVFLCICILCYFCRPGCIRSSSALMIFWIWNSAQRVCRQHCATKTMTKPLPTSIDTSPWTNRSLSWADRAKRVWNFCHVSLLVM